MLKTLKSLVKSNPKVHRFAIAARAVVRPSTNDLLRKIARAAASYVERPVFVKVGANDGLTDDPFGDVLLKTPQWVGLLVEPVPYCVDRLQAIYSDRHRFKIEQIAISSSPGAAKFYYVSEEARLSLPDLPDWFDQLGSFDRQHILRHWDGKIEPFVVEGDVKCDTLECVLRRHQLSQVTLLHIDTEGHDLVVLRSIDLEAVSPSWIMIEHRHLSEDDRADMISLLHESDYDITDTGHDFFAIHRKANHELGRSGRVGRLLTREFLTPAR